MIGAGTQPAAVREAVDKIAASRAFHGLERLSHFLRFVVGEAIDGRADQLKEYVIGVEVYQKDAASYDPRSDSTVRVEASKLRAKLRKYYETEGQTDTVVISIPKGSYAPAFDLRQKPRPVRRNLFWMAPAAAVLVTAGGAVIWLGSRSTPAPPPAPRTTPLTSFQGNELRPSLSPDARQVAFSWNGVGQDNYDIYIMTIGGGAPLRLTNSTDREDAPAWSPDGRQIAFLRAGAVFLIPPTGGEERKLAAAKDSSIAWTPDGKNVAIPGSSGIALVSITTGETRRLTTPPEKSKGDSQPAISPDGKTLAFVRHQTSAGASLCLVSMAGGEPRCRPPENDIAGVTWMADGVELLFSISRGSAYQLWRIPAGRGFAGEAQSVAGAGENASYPVVAGGRLAYQRLQYDVNIWRIEASAPVSKGSSPTRLVSSTRWDTNPQYSPDGERIAFVSDRTGEFELWTCDREANTYLQLTSLRGPSIESPRWSPDGSRIAFASAAGGNGDIYVAGLDGISLRRLTTEDTTEAAPSWSRDGRTIYFRSDRSGTDQIWKMPAGGSAPMGAGVQVTRQGGFEAMESPDGQWLYYVKPAQPGLWRVPLSPRGPVSMRPSLYETLVLEAVHRGYWAAAGKGIYWVQFTPEKTGGEIRFHNTETNQSSEIGRVQKLIVREIPGFSVTRDGRWILFSQADQSDADLILLDQFR